MISFTGCTWDQAVKALQNAKGDASDAVNSILNGSTFPTVPLAPAAGE